VIWVVVIGLAGYALGHLMELILADVRKYELWITLGLFVIGSVAGIQPGADTSVTHQRNPA
jgi:membrane protein DedA with SNARE-associated domain